MSLITATITPGPSTSSAVKANSTTGSSTTPTSGSSNGQLTQADFLKIMVAQFTNQTPMSSDSGGNSGTSDYINELMSMTNLTTMQTMSNQMSMQLAGTLPGSTVILNNNGVPVSGQVTNATIENATLYVTVNGAQYPASDLVSITQTQAQAAAATSTSTTGSTSTTTPSS